MFREMRRKGRQLSPEICDELLEQGRRAAFSVIGEDGYPYTIPVNYWYDGSQKKIYFHTALEGHKVDAIHACDKVCLTVWNEGELKEGNPFYYVSSVVVFGRASFSSDPGLKEKVCRQLTYKYYPTHELADEQMEKEAQQGAFQRMQIVCVEIEHMTGKRVHEQ